MQHLVITASVADRGDSPTHSMASIASPIINPSSRKASSTARQASSQSRNYSAVCRVSPLIPADDPLNTKKQPKFSPTECPLADESNKKHPTTLVETASMAAVPSNLAPRVSTPSTEEFDGKTIANGITEQKVIKINVSGYKYYTYLSTLSNYPDTLLGSLDRECHFNKELNCYFFDRNRKAFESILNFYRTGSLQCPNSVDIKDFEGELEFFRITAKNTPDEIAATTKKKPQQYSDWPRWQRRVYYIVAEPGEDFRSRAWACIDTFFILCSIVLFIAETEPYFKDRIVKEDSAWHHVFFWGDAACVIFFLFDFVVRFVVWPGKCNFVKSVLNWLDFLAILPFFIQLITENLVSNDSAVIILDVESEDDVDVGKGQFVALKVLRLMRVIRLLKLARHSEQLMIIVTVLKKSLNELSILVLLWMIGIVTFGSIIYYADSGHPEGFDSIMIGCWWAVVTMSTVGYGDLVPKTGAGKVLGSAVVFLSMIFLALPMTIIVSKFSSCYDDLKYKDDDRYVSSDEEEEEDAEEVKA